MRILGIVASPNRMGNSDILVRQMLRGARSLGADVNVLRLYDFNIGFCEGCKQCFAAAHPKCPLTDDAEGIFREIERADGMIVGCPIYIHETPAVLKALIDRMRSSIRHRPGAPARPADFVFVHTLDSAFEQVYALPTLLNFAQWIGFTKSEVLSVRAGSPGECLLDAAVMEHAFAAGRRLCGEPGAVPTPCLRSEHGLTVCPGCGNVSFALRDATAICPVCKQEGDVVNGAVVWRGASEFGDFRKMLEDHYEWTSRGNDALRTNFRKIAEARIAFKNKEPEIPFVTKENLP